MRYRVKQDKGGNWRWSEVAGNGEIIASGEGYTRRADVVRSIKKRLADLRREVEIVDDTGKLIATV